MSAVLKIAEQMVKLDRLIKASRDDKLKRIMRDEYKRLSDQVALASETQSKREAMVANDGFTTSTRWPQDRN